MNLSKKTEKTSRKYFIVLYNNVPNKPSFAKLSVYIDSTLNYMKDNFSETDKFEKLQKKYFSKDSITAKPIFESLCEKLINENDTLTVDFIDKKFYTEENYAGSLLNSPEFIPVFDKIRLLTFSSAYKELQSLSDEKQKTGTNEALDILGLKVASKTAVIVSPIIIIFLLFYLITLIIHLDIVYSIEKGSVETFPWLGLFSNTFSRIILVLSVWFLPVGSILLLVFKSGLSFVSKLQVSGLYLIIFSIISIIILRKIFQFQKKTLSSSSDNNTFL